MQHDHILKKVDLHKPKEAVHINATLFEITCRMSIKACSDILLFKSLSGALNNVTFSSL